MARMKTNSFTNNSWIYFHKISSIKKKNWRNYYYLFIFNFIETKIIFFNHLQSKDGKEKETFYQGNQKNEDSISKPNNPVSIERVKTIFI